MAGPPRASVIVRVRDEARTLERTLRLLREQTVEVEILVIDSGSRDGSLEIAGRWCDRLIQIAPHEFTYGRALNLGAEAAAAPFQFAISGHCFAERRDWVERSLAHYARPEVAATNGIQTFPDGRPVREPFFQDLAHARAHPFWGFSNHASSWRASVRDEIPFDEDLDYTEDKEWALRVLAAGWTIVFDPAIYVDQSHYWRGGARDFFNRERRANRATRTFTEVPPYGLADLLREWWSGLPDDGHSKLFHRLNYRRMAGLAGRYVGAHQTHPRR